MALLETYGRNIKLLQDSLRIYVETIEGVDLQQWLDKSSEMLEIIQNFAVTGGLNVHQKQKCQAYISQLVNIKNRLHTLLRRTGGRLQDPRNAAVQQDSEISKETVRWDDVSSVFQNRVSSGVITNLAHVDIKSFLEDARSLFEEKINAALEKHDALKSSVELSAEFAIIKSNVEEIEVKHFNTPNSSIFKTTDLKEWYNNHVIDSLLNQVEEFESCGSGWSLRQLLSMIVNMIQFQPMHAGSFIDLPIYIKKKRACINVENVDDMCFKWSILAGLYPAQRNMNQVYSYIPYSDKLNFSGLSFPFPLNHVKKFEKQNDVSVNVFILRKFGNTYQVRTAHVTAFYKPSHVNLLLLQDQYIDEKNDPDGVLKIVPKFHWVYIKDLSRLVKNQLINYKGKIHFCDRCLHYFITADKLERHKSSCLQLNNCSIRLPTEKNNQLKFENFQKSEKVSYVIYSDIESLLIPTEKSPAIQKHQAFAIGYYLKNSYDDAQSYYKNYRQTKDGQQTPAQWFIKELKRIATELEEQYKNPKPMIFTERDW